MASAVRHPPSRSNISHPDCESFSATMGASPEPLPNTRKEMEQIPCDTTTDSQNQQPTIHIGKIIEAEVRRQHKSVTWLSNAIHCDRRNIYNIFKRESIDTELLRRISLTLNVNFFSAYCHNLDSLPAPESNHPCAHQASALPN